MRAVINGIVTEWNIALIADRDLSARGNGSPSGEDRQDAERRRCRQMHTRLSLLVYSRMAQPRQASLVYRSVGRFFLLRQQYDLLIEFHLLAQLGLIVTHKRERQLCFSLPLFQMAASN